MRELHVMAAGGHEFDLIARIRQRASIDERVPLGIGDDAALVAIAAQQGVLVATDVLMEGVHFDFDAATPQQVGRKALAVNLSDMAAMAGHPTAAFVGLVLSRSRGIGFGDDLMAGLLELAANYDTTIAGGDTNIWDGPTVISVTLLGEPTGGGPVTRSGAQVGDWLMVTGALGGSLQGRHLTFTPRVVEAERLNARIALHAMIDLSDGLSSDIQHVLNESGVGAILDGKNVPIHADVDESLPAEERLRRALTDGEDFELLITVSPEAGQQLLDQPLFETPLTRIGKITPNPGCQIITEAAGPIPVLPAGWQHRFDE